MQPSDYVLSVCVDGAEISREFDPEGEAIDVIGEALRQKGNLPESVVTILVAPAPDGREAEWGEMFLQMREGDLEAIEQAITLLRTHAGCGDTLPEKGVRHGRQGRTGPR